MIDYHFHAKVECQLSLSGQRYQKSMETDVQQGMFQGKEGFLG